MHIYAFGSLCRGEVSLESDVDLLALVDGHDKRFDPNKYSIYSYGKMSSLWSNGSPFAWHLALESRLLFAFDGVDYLSSLGQPAPYRQYREDCEKFLGVFLAARLSLAESETSSVFDLSTVFLSIRNLATCFSLGVLGRPNFSRHSALALDEECALRISPDCYRILERSRILCTRSSGADISSRETSGALTEFGLICEWMSILVEKRGNMSEFSSRVDAQRQILKIVNESTCKTEQLFALSGKAIQRWSAANEISSSTKLIRLLHAASAQIFVMANHSDDPIAGTYLLTKERVTAIGDQIREELGRTGAGISTR
jgi:hypothetical protein